MATIDHSTPERPTPQPSAYSTLNRALVNVYTLNWETVAYTLLFVLALFTRFWDLGARVMSHDESLHTYYSWQLYDRGDFNHTPLMHGPLLFHMTALSYFLFGVNDFAGRAYVAALGVLIVLMPILFRRWLGRIGAVAASIGFLVSPMLLYYSRYIRHDIPTIFFAMVMIYAILQYVDGENPRRPVWLAVLAAAMSLMMASKEVAFIYVAIIGSFFLLHWLLRLLQGFTFSPTETIEEHTHSPIAERIYMIVGQLLSGLMALGAGILIGGLIHLLWKAEYDPTPVSRPMLMLGAAVGVFILFQLIGVVNLLATGHFRNLGAMFATGLRHTRSVMMLILVGVAVGGVIALVMFTVVDIIKPDNIWQETTYNQRINEQALALYPDDPTQQQVYLQANLPKAGQKIGAYGTELNEDLLQSAITWIAVPTLLLIFILMLIAVLKSPRGLFSWQDLLVILLIAFIAAGFMLIAEQRSVHSHELHQIEEQMQKDHKRKQDILRERLGGEFVPTPFHIDKIDNSYLYVSYLVLGLLTAVVVLTRLLTNVWDYFNRHLIFDPLIVMGTAVFPWLAAIPLFAAGYNLDQVPLTGNTVDAAILISIPFFVFSAAVGMAWNWRNWPLAAVAFWVPFAVFFTTFFTNGNGLGTGVIGSLGYWLEQQGVWRGSQPQYYYTLVQVPLYEYMPLIFASMAGLFGISEFWKFRAESHAVDRSNRDEHIYLDDDEFLDEEMSFDDLVDLESGEADTLSLSRTELFEMQAELTAAENRPRWNQPYNEAIEMGMRANFLEYLGPIPFLQFLAYWAIMIFVGLTMAGEKMPWLTTHITVPLILISGWYIGHVIQKIRLSTLRESGWALVMVVVPVFVVAFVELLLPYVTGESRPFQGDQPINLEATGKWLAALLALVATGYFMFRIAMRTGFDQARRVIFLTVAIILTFVTARHAWLASFINYDYATELLVYAHSGPAVKTTMDDIDYLADRHPEGSRFKIVYDEESTWPFVWYLRDYKNLTYVTTESVRSNPGQLDGATVVIVGEDKNADVERILGDDYYKFDYIRLWWPMQEYFNLNYDRVTNLFADNAEVPAASMFRRGIWDIWWERDYDHYGEAMCVEQKASTCLAEGTILDEKKSYDPQCIANLRNQCVTDNDRFRVEDWPVRDKLFVYIDKDFAVQVWDVGLDGQSVAERLTPDPENAVQTSIEPVSTFGETVNVTETLSGPRGIATDSQGNIYVTDTNNSRIVAFDSAGNFMTFVGVGQLNEPWGIAVSPVDGNLYVADTWNHRVAVFNPSGEMIDTFGAFGRPQDPTYADPQTMYGPRNVTVDLEGYIYVADTGGHRIRVYDNTWTHIRDIGGEGTGLGQMLEPVGVAVHPISGDIYVAETWNSRISVYNREGTPIRSWEVNMWKGSTSYNNRPYLTFSPDGTLVVVSDMDATGENNGPRVVAYDLGGQAVISFNAPPGSPATVDNVADLAFLPDGRLVVVDATRARMVVFPPLAVSGTIAPIPHPVYGMGDNADTVDEAPPAVDDTGANPAGINETDVAEASFLGDTYWRALANGNYETFVSLYCESQVPLLPAADEWLASVAGPYLNVSLIELTIQTAVIDSEHAIVNWGGNIIFQPYTEGEYRVPAEQIAPLELVKQDGRWQICETTVFRPGGG